MAQVRLSVLYPETEGASFDQDYYRDKHVPLAASKWNPAAVTIEKGISGPYVAAVHFTFESQDAMNAALGGPDTGAIQADVANYTTINPVMQISEVVS
jgi:uncharacterized protein (TIGR02118 family)